MSDEVAKKVVESAVVGTMTSCVVKEAVVIMLPKKLDTHKESAESETRPATNVLERAGQIELKAVDPVTCCSNLGP